MLDDMNDLLMLLAAWPGGLGQAGERPADGLYCPSCGDVRRMLILPVYLPPGIHLTGLNLAGDIGPQLVSSLFRYRCVQCDTRFTAVVYRGSDGPALAVLPSVRGGLTTPHTPPGVAFYLDQASKAQSVGANSGAIAMFRGALEHLLFEQGYTDGMLGTKIGKLIKAIEQGSAPKWAMELDSAFLEVIKDLGNASIHPNDGDVTKQAVFDNHLLARVKQCFHLLLFLVYEVPHKKGELLKELKAKAAVLKKQ